MTVRFYVDSWDPAYGASDGTGDDPAPSSASTAQVRFDVEKKWAALNPPAVNAPGVVLFVDGVRRIDATVWVEHADGAVLPGVAASYAAGVVRCDLRQGTAEVTAARVRRGVFTPSGQATPIWEYAVERVDATDPGQLSRAIQPSLSTLEAEVSQAAREPDDLLVLDGPLRGRNRLERALGYIKSHAKQYLPAEKATLVAQLRPGQRTPVFRLGTSWDRYSWYLKLPGPAGAPWAGVVRLEASAELTPKAAVELADRSAVTLPRFASRPYKDPRAPQNLIPIAGLESRLRRMLGDARVLMRTLRAASG
jgi:hypothetical protein